MALCGWHRSLRVEKPLNQVFSTSLVPGSPHAVERAGRSSLGVGVDAGADYPGMAPHLCHRKTVLAGVPLSRTKPNVLKIWGPQTGMEESVTTMAAIEPALPSVAATYDWKVGGKRPANNPINTVGKKACAHFLEQWVRNTLTTLPLKGRYPTARNLELDDFLEWSGVTWRQLVGQSKHFAVSTRQLRPFTKEHSVKLMTKVLNHPELGDFNAAAWDRMLRLTECSEAVMGNFAKRVVTVLRGKHVLGGLLNAYVSKLGEAFIRCLPEEAKHLDAATLEYTRSRYELQDEFTSNPAVTIFFTGRDLSIFAGFTQEDDDWDVENAEITFPGFLESAIFKEFNYRIFFLDRPVILVELKQLVSVGRPGRVCAYTSGWTVHREINRIRKFLAPKCVHPKTALASFESWSGVNSVEADVCKASGVPSSLLELRCKGRLKFPSRKFFDFCCVMEDFLSRHLSVENMRFLGCVLMQRLRRDLCASSEVTLNPSP